MASGEEEPVRVSPAVRRLHEMQRHEARRAIIRSLARSCGWAAALVTAYYQLPIEATSWYGVAIRVVVASTLIGVVVFWQLRAVTRSDMPQLRAVEALAVAVTLMVVLFASAYVSISLRDPPSFNEPLGRTSALYFTMTTLATIGFGDIAARTDGARIVVMIQIVFNVAVLGVAVRLIVRVARQRMQDGPAAL